LSPWPNCTCLLALALHAEQGSLLFLQTGEALGGSVGLLFQTAQLAFGVCDDRDSLVALARRGVQLTLRGLYLGLEVGKGFGGLGAFLFQVGDILRCRARLFRRLARLLAAASACCSRPLSWLLVFATTATVLSRSLVAASS
jgi:hypothetical protein